MDSLDTEVENLWERTKERLADYVEEYEAARTEVHDYLEPSDEPDSWDVKGKIVTVDVAVLALHLMAAKLAFKTFPNVLRIALGKAIGWLRSYSDKLAEKYAEQSRPGRKGVITVMEAIIAQLQEESLQREIERKIRETSLNFRRDLHLAYLPTKPGRRKTKEVVSRHKAKRQRRPNKSWRSPR